MEINSLRDKLIYLRENFIAFGEFTITFQSKTNLFHVKYEFKDHKEVEFLKSGFEDVLDELKFILDGYKKEHIFKDIPRYIR